VENCDTQRPKPFDILRPQSGKGNGKKKNAGKFSLPAFYFGRNILFHHPKDHFRDLNSLYRSFKALPVTVVATQAAKLNPQLE